MFALVRALFARLVERNKDFEFGFTIRAKARGGFAGIVVMLKPPEGGPRRPSMDHLREISLTVTALLGETPVVSEMSLPEDAVQVSTSPYQVVGPIVVRPLNDYQLMRVYEELSSLSSVECARMLGRTRE